MYKIQSRTIFGWFDIMGDFETIKEAQEKIPRIQEELSKANSEYYSVLSILKISDKKEMAINDNYVYEKDEF
jgi:hypothetical protein